MIVNVKDDKLVINSKSIVININNIIRNKENSLLGLMALYRAMPKELKLLFFGMIILLFSRVFSISAEELKCLLILLGIEKTMQ